MKNFSQFAALDQMKKREDNAAFMDISRAVDVRAGRVLCNGMRPVFWFFALPSGRQIAITKS